MAERLIRRLLFSRSPLKGYFRFGDVFQVMPAPDSWPRPPFAMGDYPLILELRYDPELAPEREKDYWHRDVWERARDHELGTEGWTDDQIAARRQNTEMMRSTAIVKELTVLLSALTNHKIFDYDSSQSWTISRSDSDKAETRWAQRGYAMPEFSWPNAEFLSDPTMEEAPRVPIEDHYRSLPDSYVVGSGDENQVRFPDALDVLLSIYFEWEADRKQAFYAACHLWGQASDLKNIKAPSMSLLASVSAIETLVNFSADPGPSCRECGVSPSIEKCGVCGSPRYRLNSRFKEFLMDFAGPETESLAGKLYNIRGRISHDGDLLREELFDSGFTKGGKDEQMIFQHSVTLATHIALVNWLINNREKG